MNLNLSDLPPEAVEKLKSLSRHEFGLLSIDAALMRENEAKAKLPSDPMEAAAGANACLIRSDTMIDVDDAAGFVESVLEIASTALGNPDFDDTDATHLHRIMRAAVDAQRASMSNTREANERLRAALQPVKSGGAA
ncbi:hypothetical protein [Roseovarius sp. D0-M9]|uniref:hypothetical protein n=1 Tax=Roseovarius sp. D0-M9 TaxID=3127117 RepID=UPI00300FC81B